MAYQEKVGDNSVKGYEQTRIFPDDQGYQKHGYTVLDEEREQQKKRMVNNIRQKPKQKLKKHSR